MIYWYDKQGNQISPERGSRLAENFSYKKVKSTNLPGGKWVSTVWLGMDHAFGSGAPLIFETMVFPSESDFTDLDCRRYSTEEEAVTGHDEMVDKWSAKA